MKFNFKVKLLEKTVRYKFFKEKVILIYLWILFLILFTCSLMFVTGAVGLCVQAARAPESFANYRLVHDLDHQLTMVFSLLISLGVAIKWVLLIGTQVYRIVLPYSAQAQRVKHEYLTIFCFFVWWSCVDGYYIHEGLRFGKCFVFC